MVKEGFLVGYCGCGDDVLAQMKPRGIAEKSEKPRRIL